PVASPAAAAARRGTRIPGDRGLLAPVVPEVLARRRIRTLRATLAHHAEGAYLCAHRRAGRGADDLAPGGDRRRAQLGLPLLLAARCDAHAPSADERRLLRRGARLARLADARGRRQPRADADHARACRRTAPRRADGGLAARLRELAPGACR